MENRFQLDCFSSSCKLCKNPIINRCLKTSEKVKTAAEQHWCYFFIIQNHKIIKHSWYLVPFFLKLINECVKQSKACQWSKALIFRSKCVITFREPAEISAVLVSSHMKTFDRTVSSRCWQYAVKSHRFHVSDLSEQWRVCLVASVLRHKPSIEKPFLKRYVLYTKTIKKKNIKNQRKMVHQPLLSLFM